ncbi:MAG: hypothetical protein AVDCRST_MAG76-3721 [uncultured Acidimicrobiales bacterium]|uniref:Uncharacterized protein n=1 Tax=uncultured Acidimicrobiales bacterium TaxID=310071 RepID=A0A6J4JDA5_9ACTN|nr:MAG: hypothetical protein AVDCRST_MAG76-3721 [uncultured Acidimicrobiales bacterium]
MSKEGQIDTIVGSSSVAARGTHVRLPHVRRTRRLRRPSGAPPPLPRSIGWTGKGWLAATGLLLAWVATAAAWEPAARATDRADAAVLRAVARLRTGWLTTVLDRVDRLASGWLPTIIAIALIVLLLVFRRWRHLFTFLGTVLVTEGVSQLVYELFARPRPFGVTTIGRWFGFSMPSPPVVITTVFVVAIVYTLTVPGHPRNLAKAAAGLFLAAFAFAQLYLGTAHPFDVLVAITLAVGIGVNAFRFFTPSEVFPVTYRRGKTAHLDVGGRRGEALCTAVKDQLGLTVTEIKPVGLAGSGGSTPLRLRVAGEPDTYLFGKLYAMTHVRADRWYKIGRTILYGGLEDEAPFQSVRRLVTYEDYALRLLEDVGVPTATPHGIVELTPEREYLLVTEFFDGAKEIGDAEVDDSVIDQGLALIHQLWEAGLAHRDIKPANLLVQDGRLVLIDPAFVQVRPSPWRQAVDLANMLFVLAVRTDADRVYQRALARFTPDEIAEALAAARGVASPSQLRTALKKDGRDLVARFRALAPPRPPIKLQRWNVKRVLLAVILVGGGLISVPLTISLLSPENDIPLTGSPSCGTGRLMILMAQSVPSATSVPCLGSLPAGWELGGTKVHRGRSVFWLDSDRAGRRAAEVTLLPSCGLAGALGEPSDEPGMKRYRLVEPGTSGSAPVRAYVFPGGCVTYRFNTAGGDSASLRQEAERALTFQPRVELVTEVYRRSGLYLCGVLAPCPG